MDAVIYNDENVELLTFSLARHKEINSEYSIIKVHKSLMQTNVPYMYITKSFFAVSRFHPYSVTYQVF